MNKTTGVPKKTRHKLFVGNHWSKMVTVSQKTPCMYFIMRRDLVVETQVKEDLKEQSFCIGTMACSVAYSSDRDAVSGAKADTLCVSRSEEEVGESTFGSFIYNKL